MKHYDLLDAQDIQAIGDRDASNDAQTAIPQDVANELTEAEAHVDLDPVGDLDFVMLLLSKMKETHQQTPDTDLAFSVDGRWTATFQTTRKPQKESQTDPDAA